MISYRPFLAILAAGSAMLVAAMLSDAHQFACAAISITTNV